MSAPVQQAHVCGVECVTDPVDRSVVHTDLVGVVEGVEVRASSDGGAPRVLIDADGLVDVDRCTAIQLAVKLLTAAARFEGPGAR